MTNATTYRLAEGVTFQDLGPGQDTVVLSIQSGQMFTCNDTATELLKRLQAGTGFQAAIDELAAVYDIDRATLERDMTALVDQLVAEKLVVPAETA